MQTGIWFHPKYGFMAERFQRQQGQEAQVLVREVKPAAERAENEYRKTIISQIPGRFFPECQPP